MEFSIVFGNFAKLLDERLNAGVFTTEDSVRYTFFHAILVSGLCKPSEIILELPHPTIPKAEIDLFIKPLDGQTASAFEFKYDRSIPSEKNVPRTQKAGAVFKDLFRLARIPAETDLLRIFIYMASREMRDYFRNPGNRLDKFFDLHIGETYSLNADFLASKAHTFQSVAGAWFIPLNATCLYCHELCREHALRIFKIET